jgi:preprotein translocase subunit SecY
LIAGTAFVIWLADQITRHGLGSGVWIIIIASTAAELWHVIASLLDYQRLGIVAGPMVLLGGAFIVLAVAAIAALLLAGGRTMEAASACLWPVVLAYTVLPWLLVLGGLLGQATGADASMPWMEFGHPVRLAVLAVLIGVFMFLYVRSDRIAGVAPPAVPPTVIGGTLALIAVGSEALPTYFSVPMILDGQSLPIIAIVMTSILIDWGFLRRAG